MAHTHGPWKHAPLSNEVIGPRGEGVCSPCDGYDEDQWNVDAPLIAAAPELLTALKRLLRYDFGDSIGAVEARAAIAKAEGGIR